MMRPSFVRRLFGCQAAILLAAGCSASADGDAQVPADPDSVAAPDSVYVETVRETLPPDRIYHVLTDHEWYARGESLLHDGAEYSPAGMPVAASLPGMQLIGEYQGVDYYAMGGQPGVLYVPVYEGYWQPFRAIPPPQTGE